MDWSSHRSHPSIAPADGVHMSPVPVVPLQFPQPSNVARLQVGNAAPGQTAPLVPVNLSSEEITNSQSVVGLTARVIPQTFTTPNQKTTQLTIVGNQTGASKTITVTVNKTVLGSPSSGGSS